jgi:plastocyanin
MRLAVLALAFTLAVTACGGDGSSLDTAAVPTQLGFTVQPSSATAGQPITPPIQVAIEDASGNLVNTGTNPITLSLPIHPNGGTLGGTTTVNAQGGVATFSNITVSKPGTGFVLSASVSGPGLIPAISDAFDMSPVPGLAVAIAAITGDQQTGTVGAPLPINPSVKVTDGFGNPVANAGVTFSVASGEGSAIGTDQVTDAAGVATVGEWTLGTRPMANTLVATLAGIDHTSVTFTASATTGPAAQLTKAGGDEQVTRVGTSVGQPPAVRVTDAYGNPVAAAPVTFTVASGGGSLSEPAQTTGTDGEATVGSWTLGKRAGRNTLRAASAGLDGSPAIFTATAIVASAVVEVRDNYFRSLNNGSGGEDDFLGQAAVDTIPVGGTVLWQWSGTNHNVTPYFNPVSSPLSGSGTHSAPFTYGPVTFTERGTYRYRCTIHSQVVDFLGLFGMRGDIVVR